MKIVIALIIVVNPKNHYIDLLYQFVVIIA